MTQSYLTYEDLPSSMQFLADFIGLEATIKIIRRYGGSSLYIHKTTKPHSTLCGYLGETAYQKLISGYGGENLKDIPRACDAIRKARNRRIREWKFAGMTNSSIASRMGITERSVRRILQQITLQESMEN